MINSQGGGHSPLQLLEDPLFTRHKVKVWVKRDDLLHPHMGGNKWRKLKYNLQQIKAQGVMVYSLGGAYSNHLLALAYAAAAYAVPCVGVVFGAVPQSLTPTLLQAQALGMRLLFVSRQQARVLETPVAQQALMQQQGVGVWLPLGASNAEALRGCAELVAEIREPFDSLWCAVGSGGTCAGLATAIAPGQEVVGVAAVKDRQLPSQVARLVATAGGCAGRWRLLFDYVGRGFAKLDAPLLAFMHAQERRHRLLLDGVYNAKLWFACYESIRRGEYDNKTLVLLHTGGLQGRYGLPAAYFSVGVT